MKPLRDAMRREAGWVWRGKARAEALGLFLNEETITESTLLSLATGFLGHGFFVQLFSKAVERKNGADWEFWFVQGARAVGLRVQAKRLFPAGTYKSLKPNDPQITTLISNSGNCCPVYVFYNDLAAYPASLPVCLCNEYRGRSYLGCTLAPATAVLRATSNSASLFQRIAIPWHCLLCDGAAGKTSLPEIIAENLNRYVAPADSHRCEVVRTPSRFQSYTDVQGHLGPKVIGGDGYGEPQWLSEYLVERELAGIALVGATEGTG